MKRVFIIVFVAILLLTGCNANKQTDTTVLTPVETQAAQRGDLVVSYKTTGTIKPIKEVSITSKITGRIDAAYKNVGDLVSANELLFTVEKTDAQNQLSTYQSQINQAQAGVDVAKAALDRTAGASSDQQLMQAENALSQANTAKQQAQIAYDSAKSDYDNNKILYDSGAIAKTTLDSMQTRLDNALATLNSAKSAAENAAKNYELIQGSINPSSVKSAQAQLKQAQAAAQSAQTQANAAVQRINDSNVRSPIKGIVSAKNVEVGQMTPQGPAYTIVDISKVTVEVEVSEKYINNIQLGSKADVQISSIGEQKFEGTIVTVSPAPSAQKAGYLVRVEIDNSDLTIKAGMFATTTFSIGKKQDVVKIPLNALIKDSGKNAVYIIDQDTAKYQEIKIGDDDSYEVEVLSGIEEGMQVVVKGQQLISDDEKVQVINQ